MNSEKIVKKSKTREECCCLTSTHLGGDVPLRAGLGVQDLDRLVDREVVAAPGVQAALPAALVFLLHHVREAPALLYDGALPEEKVGYQFLTAALHLKTGWHLHTSTVLYQRLRTVQKSGLLILKAAGAKQ